MNNDESGYGIGDDAREQDPNRPFAVVHSSAEGSSSKDEEGADEEK